MKETTRVLNDVQNIKDTEFDLPRNMWCGSDTCAQSMAILPFSLAQF